MATYPGDYDGPLDPGYAPEVDGEPDPGEVVWAHVPFEDDHSRGKDRPVLVVGRDGRWLLGMQLTSRDHDRDAAQEERAGRYWVDVGSGGWDGQSRPSEVRVNRVVRIDPSTVRREGAVLDRARWDEVIAANAAHPHPQGDRSPRPRRSTLDRFIDVFRRH
ncbi:type II toxin-antitoxin system PemK/MazF family toxin [Knoellia locipacati]|uniref:type II toxin-antitoxin system PemK/MazF family toxin n=1 Tax=Knoellia locipacati TaxID=882824 RepID=UPI00384A9746